MGANNPQPARTPDAVLEDLPVKWEGDIEDALPQLISLQSGEQILLAKEMTWSRPWAMLSRAYVWVTSSRLVMVKGHGLTILPAAAIEDVRVSWTDMSLVTIRYRGEANQAKRFSLAAGGRSTFQEERKRLMEALRICCATRPVLVRADSTTEDVWAKIRKPVLATVWIGVAFIAVVVLWSSLQQYRSDSKAARRYSDSAECRSGLAPTTSPGAPCQTLQLRVTRKFITTNTRSFRGHLELTGVNSLYDAVVANRDFYSSVNIGSTVSVQVFRNQITLVGKDGIVLRTPTYPEDEPSKEALWIVLSAFWVALPIWFLWSLFTNKALYVPPQPR